MRGASDLLKGNACALTFTRKESVQIFSNVPAVVDSPAARDAVYQVKGDVKVGREITPIGIPT